MNQLTVDIGTTNMSIGLTYLYVGHRHNALLFRHMSDTPKYVCPVFHYSPFYFTPIYSGYFGHVGDTVGIHYIRRLKQNN